MLITANIYDPPTSDEGTIDPLGLAPISERLANRLLPGLRQRMTHPRFLTASAASAHVCKYFQDRIAADGKTEAALVFEWHIVQALFKKYGESADELLGLPGIRKAKECWIKGDPLSMNRYLKNAYTFGFQGVYRTLAEEIDIIAESQLGSQGDALLRIWENEQGIPGFISSGKGAGKEIYDALLKAVELGLEKGEVARPWAWKTFDEIAPLFAPKQAGIEEKRFIKNLIISDKTGFRRELFDAIPGFLKSHETKELRTDRNFHEYLLPNASHELKQQILAVRSYELFGRAIHNPFYKVLEYLSERTRKISASELHDILKKQIDIVKLRDLFQETSQALDLYNERLSFESTFSAFIQIQDKDSFIQALLKHHQKIQTAKPPNGKMPWLENFQDGYYMIRPSYRDREFFRSEYEYVNFYRLHPLINFHFDLN